MKIRHFFFLCMSMVGALALLSALNTVANTIGARNDVQQASALVTAQGALLRLAEQVSLERGIHILALTDDAPPVPDVAAKLVKSRQATDDAFAQALPILPPDTAKTIGQWQENLQAARTPMLAALNKVQTERPAGAGKAWTSSNFAVGDAIIAEGSNLLVSLNRLNGTAGDFIALAHLSASLRNLVGQRNTTLLNIIDTGAPLSPKQWEKHSQFTGHVNEIWDILQKQTSFIDAGDEVKAKLAAVDTAVQHEAMAVIGKIEDAARIHAPYPMSAGEFRQTTVGKFATIGQLRDAYIARAQVICERELATLNQRLAVAIAMLVVLAAMIAVVTAVFNRRVVSSLMTMAGIITRIAENDLDIAVPDRQRHDEIGKIGQALETLRGNALNARQAEAAMAAERGERDVIRRQTDVKLKDFATQVDAMMIAVHDNIGALHHNADTLGQLAKDASRGSGDVTRAAEQAAVNVQTIAAATEQLLASIGEISQVVTKMADVSRQAVRQAEGSRTTVHELTGAAERIGEIVALINQIASQTNLLALNATIEAARAGEAGKGFAVVAGEVKALANQTAKATDQIQAQVSAIQKGSDNAYRAISEIDQTVGHISELATSIASAVEEQNCATAEISRSIQQASDGVGEVASTIATVRESVDSTEHSAAEVKRTADDVASETDGLHRQFNTLAELLRHQG